jgi:hypothetical protein
VVGPGTPSLPLPARVLAVVGLCWNACLVKRLPGRTPAWSNACLVERLPPSPHRPQVIEDVDKDRRYAIDAAIVRTMKSRKILGHQALVMEVVQQLSRMFKPDFKQASGAESRRGAAGVQMAGSR